MCIEKDVYNFLVCIVAFFNCDKTWIHNIKDFGFVRWTVTVNILFCTLVMHMVANRAGSSIIRRGMVDFIGY